MRLLVIAALLLSSDLASAKAQTELQYRVDEVFSTATRFVRVDRGCKVTDKDPEVAFVMFECGEPGADEKHVNRGGVEIFRTSVHGREGTRVQVTLNDESHGAELRFIELLERKLREERGTPTPPPKPAPPPKPPDMATPPPF